MHSMGIAGATVAIGHHRDGLAPTSRNSMMRKKVLVIPSYLRDRPRPWLVAAALLVCRSCEQVDHNAQCLSELIERALPDDRGHPTLDIANDLVRKPHDLSPTRG